MFPFLAGMMQGLLGSGAAGAAGGAASGAGAAGMGGGIADLAGSGTMMGGGDSPNMQAFAADMVANPQGPSPSTTQIDQMPSVGGFAGGGAKGQAPGLMQAQAPGHQNDPLMQGGGMWQKIFGGGI